MIALLALLLPALLLPRGIALGACVCGTGVALRDVSLDVVVAGGAVACHCDHAHAEPAGQASDHEPPPLVGSEDKRPCSECSTVQLDALVLDLVSEAEIVAAVPAAVWVSEAAFGLVVASALRSVSEGRAPPDGVVNPAHWPRVLPLRI